MNELTWCDTHDDTLHILRYELVQAARARGHQRATHRITLDLAVGDVAPEPTGGTLRAKGVRTAWVVIDNEGFGWPVGGGTLGRSVGP